MITPDHIEIAPAMSSRLVGGPSSIPGIVDDVLGPLAWSCIPAPPTRETVEALGLALMEVLHSIVETAGGQSESDGSSVDLWIEPTLIIICVRFRGLPLPDWLVTNWNRAEEPAVLAPATECGWGWLLVREALDAVSHDWHCGEQLLFLEKRI